MKICHMQPPLLLPLVSGLVIVALIIVYLSTALAGTQAAAGVFDEKRRAELVYLVRQDCGSCHGMTLKGGLGTPLLPEHVKDTPVEALVSIILDGVPDTPMPPWRGLLSEREATWIAQQLKKGLPK